MKMKSLISMFLIFDGTFFAANAFAESCKFVPNKKTLSVQWTAYKTSDKLPVGGKFTDVKVSGKDSAKSLKAMVQGLKVQVNLSSVDTENPGRDKTLSEFFFSKLSSPSVEGQIVKYDEKSGAADLELKFNGHKKAVPVKIEAQDDQITATGEMDILNFDAKPAYESLHTQCFELHKGKDGVSKTWSTVALSIKGSFSKTCH